MKATKRLGLVAVTMLMAPGSAQAWDWQFETARHTMTAKGVYMDLSSDGIPHLAIEEQSNIRHAVRGDTGWVVEVAGSTGGSVKGAALCLDSAGRPHVVYSYHSLSGPLPDYIRHSVRTETGWVWLSNVKRNDGGFGPKALLATSSGGLALAFHEKYNDTIKYAT